MVLGTTSVAGADSGSRDVLGFETPELWSVVEGNASLDYFDELTEGSSALLVSGTYWRRIASVPLSTIGAATNLLRVDVRTDHAPEPWETVGVALQIPSKQIYWADLGQATLPTTPGEYKTLAFQVPESLRQALNESYSDLTLSVSVNSPGTVYLDNITLGESPAPAALTATTAASDGDQCASHVIELLDLEADFRDIWAGRETAETGKQSSREPAVLLEFDAPVQPSLLVAAFLPMNPALCSNDPVRAVADSAGDLWTLSAAELEGQSYPNDFNAFIHGSVYGIPDAQGALAVGQDASLRNFGLNALAQRPYGLISGGDVSLESGTVFGNLLFGGAAAIAPTATLVGGVATQASPIDFDHAFERLGWLAETLANRPSTGTVLDASGTLQLAGTSTTTNVFQVTAAELQAAYGIVIDVPSGSGVLINVLGEELTLQNKGIQLQGVTPRTLLWNVPDARSLAISSIGVPGSVLAPKATVAFNNGNLDGTLVALNLSGSGELHHFPLEFEKVLGQGQQAAVALRPVAPLERGCEYNFFVSYVQPLTADGKCLAEPLSVPFIVAPDDEPPAGRELEIASIDDASLSLRQFRAKPGINTLVDDVWARYRDSLHLAPTDLTQEGPSTAASGSAGYARSFYRQLHQGYPVLGHGYFVHDEDGLFRSAVGKVIPHLPLDLVVPVAEQVALDAALQAMGATTRPWETEPQAFSPPQSELVYVPEGDPRYPEAFVLVWQFVFAGTGLDQAPWVWIRAADGTTLRVEPAEIHALDPSTATYVGQAQETVSTPLHGPRSIDVALYEQSTGPESTLSSAAIAEPGTAGGATRVSLGTGFDETGSVISEFATDPNVDGQWSEPVLREAASAYWALLETQDFVDALAFNFQNSLWSGIDGLNAATVEGIYFDDGSPFSCGGGDVQANGWYATSESSLTYSQIILANGGTTSPVAPVLLGHEFAHGLIHNGRARAGRGLLAGYGESGAIGEGLADLFGISMVERQLPDSADWFCMALGDECLRNVAEPHTTGHAAYYRGQNYTDYSGLGPDDCGTSCDPPANDSCGIHKNATIVGHWGYLLGAGSPGPILEACGAEVEPLDGDRTAALAKALHIGLGAAMEYVDDVATFEQLRDATEFVATEGLYGTTPTDLKHVQAAWHAVGLGTPAQPEDVFPPDGATGVDPWPTFFKWSPDAPGSWTLRISTDPSFATDVFETTAGERDDGVRYFSKDLKHDTQYYWQARTSGNTTDWKTCAVISRTFRTAKKKIDVVRPTKVSNGTLDAGFLGTIEWKTPGGAPSYNVRFSKTKLSNGCSSGETTSHAGVTIGDSHDPLYEGPDFPILSNDWEPNKTHYLYVQPRQSDDNVGTCTELKFTRPKLESFKQLYPVRGQPEPGPFLQLTDSEPLVPSLWLERGFEFEESVGATAYEVEVRWLGGDDSILYQATRDVGHCGLAVGSGPHPESGNAWLSWNFDCNGEPIEGEPVLAEWIRSADLDWEIYALDGRGNRRQAWHVGDETPGGVSTENSIAYLSYDHIPAHVSEAQGITSRTYFSPWSSTAGINETIDGWPAVRYEDTSWAIVEPGTTREAKTCFYEPPPIVEGYRFWRWIDGDTDVQPEELRVDQVTEWPHCLIREIAPQPAGTELAQHLLVLPWMFEYWGTEHQWARKLTHTVSRLKWESFPEPTPEPEPEPAPAPTCSGPPSGTPGVPPQMSLDLADVAQCGGYLINCCNSIPVAIAGFAFGWDAVPGATRYKVDFHTDLLSDPVETTYVDDPEYRGVLGAPPFQHYSAGCGFHYYLITVTAINDCGEGPPATAWLAWAGNP